MARMMLPFLRPLQPFNVKGFPPLVLSQSRTAASTATVPASYADAAYYPTSAPAYSGNTATVTATHTGGVNNVACIFFHYDSNVTVTGVTFDGAAASYVIVSSGGSTSGAVAYAPCSSSGTHTWVLTTSLTTPTTQGTTVTMTGVKSTPSQTAVQSWGNNSPTTTGNITVSSNGIDMSFLGSVDTTGTWSGATAISTGSGNFPLAYSTSSSTVSYNGAATGSQMATLSWDAADAGSTITVSPSKGGLTFTGYLPAITYILAVSPSVGHLTFGGKVPVASTGFNLSPSVGHLTFGGKVPTVTVGTVVSPATGHLTFTGYVPPITYNIAVQPSAGHLLLSGKIPTVSLGVNVFPSTGHLTFGGKVAPFSLSIVPSTGHLVFTGYQPSVSGASVPSSSFPLKGMYRHRQRNC